MQFLKTHRISHKYFGFLGSLLFISANLILIGCNQSFDPLQPNNQFHFSIFGTLDASTDTQWVRVGTIRERIDELPDPNGIQVTLEDLQTGEINLMIDSVFTSRNVLNYWSTMEIKNEQSYRIRAVQPNGKTSRVTVTTPERLPTIYVTTVPQREGRIYIDDGIEHIADVQSVWYVIINPGTENLRRVYRFPLRNKIRHTFAFYGSYTASANWEKELQHIEGSLGIADYKIASRQFFVAIGGPEWDDQLSSIDDLEYFLDGTGSNVENGLGYVVGINSGWFYQTDCLAPDGSKHIPCEPVEPVW